jgi:hypothetical protein
MIRVFGIMQPVMHVHDFRELASISKKPGKQIAGALRLVYHAGYTQPAARFRNTTDRLRDY